MSNKARAEKAASQAGSHAQIKALYKKGFFQIGENKYEFIKMPFKKAKKIFAYLTAIAGKLDAGNLEFLDSEKFDDEIEPLLFEYMLFDGFKLDTLDEHFDEYPSDYIEFVTMSIQGFAAPFLPEAPTASASKVKENQPTILKKQM
jgi:hypothetical protein